MGKGGKLERAGAAEKELLFVVQVEFLVGDDFGHRGRDFARERLGMLLDAWREGVVAMVEHGLGEIVGGKSCLDTEVVQHGV